MCTDNKTKMKLSKNMSEVYGKDSKVSTDKKTGKIYKPPMKRMFFFIFVSPLLLCLVRRFYDGSSVLFGPFDPNWLSFYGSYLGGIFGGLATLLTVTYTIQNNRKEQEEKEKKEKIKTIRKSALIVYFDFDFIFDNIVKFLNQFFDWRGDIKWELTNTGERKIYLKCTQHLNQFYFDPNWIYNVANLSDCKQLGKDRIKIIYELYGHLANINKSMESSEMDVCRNALTSMRSIVDINSPTGEEKHIEVKKDIVDLKNELKSIAFDETYLLESMSD